MRQLPVISRNFKYLFPSVIALTVFCLSAGPVRAQLGPKPIVIEEEQEELDERLGRKITLDVREMNLIDVLKFLALKGNFNMVTSATVQGRVTLFLKNVMIRDALDIVLISNGMAYHRENEIIHIMSEVEYESLYGKRFNDKNIVEIIQLQYTKPSYVLAALESIKSNLGRIIIDEETGTVVLIDTKQSIQDMLSAIKEIEKPMETVVYALQYASADLVADNLRRKIEANSVGTVAVDDRTNKLIVTTYPGRRAEVEAMIEQMDSPTKEVLVEARVLQITFRPQFDFGIDWQMDFREGKNKFLNRTSIENVFLDDSNPTSNLATRFSKLAIGDFTANQFETAIRSLKQVSDTKILSNPKLLVTNNEEAKIHVGDTVPYIISTTSGTGDNAITSEDVRFVDVGLQLNVTPTINDDGFVTLRLNPEISTVATTITSQGGGIPQVNKTEVETTVMVKDGMTVVLGGLKKDNKTLSKSGMPFLMDIPYLGKLFSTTSESIESTEIVIFITPHIMTGDEGYRKYKGGIKPRNTIADEEGDMEEQALRIKP